MFYRKYDTRVYHNDYIIILLEHVKRNLFHAPYLPARSAHRSHVAESRPPRGLNTYIYIYKVFFLLKIFICIRL